jgi:hypothetical protein
VPIYAAPQGFVFHHSGGTTLAGLRATLQDRGLGSEYLMDRDGTIYAYGAPGSPHMQPNDRWGGIARGLSNKNALGMELVARNNQDVTPAQVAAARNFVATNYPNTPVYGHGEVNPGHKQADEGMAVVNAIRSDRAAPVQVAAAAPSGDVVAFPSPAFVDTGATAQAAAPPALPPPAARGPTVLTGPPTYPPAQQMPMAGETRRTAEGEQTFRAPDASNAEVRANLAWNGITNLDTATPEQIRNYWETQRYLDTQRKMDDADVARMHKAVLEGDGAGYAQLMDARKALNKFLQDFPPDKRGYYVGTLRYPADTIMQMIKDDPNIAKFHTELDAISAPLEGGSWIGRKLGLAGTGALFPGEQTALHSTLPSGATEPNTFEARLQNYGDTIDSQMQVRDFLRGQPVGAMTGAKVQAFLQGQTDDLAQRRLDSFNVAVPPGAPPATTPPTITPPSTTPPTTTPPAAAPPGPAWSPTVTWTMQ